MASRVNRTYDALRRRANADATRRHIVETAKPLFIEQGYVATSMRQLADVAGVSVQTLYNAFTSKFGLFSALIDVIVAGDHQPVAIADRPEVRALGAIDNPHELLRAMVRAATPILDRLNVIYPTLRAAAASDPLVAAAYQEFALDARYDEYRGPAVRLHHLGALPRDVDARKAADILWTVLSPDSFHSLVTHRGWSVTDFEAWATDTLVATLTNKIHHPDG